MNFNVTSKEAKPALFKFVTAACKKNIEPYFVPSKALLNAITLKKKKSLEGIFVPIPVFQE